MPIRTEREYRLPFAIAVFAAVLGVCALVLTALVWLHLYRRDAFDATTGLLRAKVAIHGQLNAPWGLALAPAGFGPFGGDLLVGNFGDGRINAYKPILGGFLYVPQGQLRTPQGDRVTIDGLWALEFGNDSAAGPSDTLFFTAGPNDEGDGLFGSITSGENFDGVVRESSHHSASPLHTKPCCSGCGVARLGGVGQIRGGVR